MTTPLAIVADSIIEFILSLLRDPAAVDELKNDPSGTLSRNHLNDVCADDVRAVAPVVYDRSDVIPRNGGNPTPRNNDTPVPPRSGDDGQDGVVREILRIANNFYIDNRSTLVDQSVNQNIWTEGGDVNQIFDQTTAIAAGDGSIAAGDDVGIDNSTDTDVDVDIDIDAQGSGDIPLDDALDVATDVVEPALDGATDDLPLPDDAEDLGLEDALTTEAIVPDPAEAAAQAAAAASAAAAPVEEIVEAAPAAAAVEVDESVWDTTETVVEDEPLYDDEILEDQ